MDEDEDEAYTEDDWRGRWKDVAPEAAKLLQPKADPCQDLLPLPADLHRGRVDT